MDLFNSITSFQAMQPTKPRDTKPPKWFIEWSTDFEKRINARFDKIEARLDEHDKIFESYDSMFKSHGWIK